MLNALLGWLKPKVCRHEFAYEDLHQTGIPEPEKPATNDYKAWEKWYSDYYDSDHVTKRVVWPCAKCGQVFMPIAGWKSWTMASHFIAGTGCPTVQADLTAQDLSRRSGRAPGSAAAGPKQGD